MKLPPRVLQITDRHAIDVETVARRIAAAPGPGFAVIVRDKDLPRADRRALATRLRGETTATGSRLIVAVDVELALEIGADGVHLASDAFEQLPAARERVGPDAWLSIACHAPEDVARAAALGASAALLSPIFETPGKGAPLGLAALGQASRALGEGSARCWLVALGGIDAGSAAACFDAGADSVASIRADLTSWASR